MISQETLKSIIHYNPSTGVFTWKKRHRGFFTTDGQCKSWNSRNAGKKCRTEPSHKDNPYVSVRIFGKSYKQHRLAFLYMNGSMPEEVDHVNGIHNDNRFDNLRPCNRIVNARNLPLRKGKSLPIGISKSGKKFRARISVKGDLIYLGTFETVDDALKARFKAMKKYGFDKNHGRTQ